MKTLYFSEINTELGKTVRFDVRPPETESLAVQFTSEHDLAFMLNILLKVQLFSGSTSLENIIAEKDYLHSMNGTRMWFHTPEEAAA